MNARRKQLCIAMALTFGLAAWSAHACEKGELSVALDGKTLCERTVAGKVNVFVSEGCKRSCQALEFVGSELLARSRGQSPIGPAGAQSTHSRCKEHDGKLVEKKAADGNAWTACAFADGSIVTLGF